MKRTVIQCVRQILEDAMARCCEAVCIQTSELLRSRHGYQQSKLGHTAVAEESGRKDRRAAKDRAKRTTPEGDRQRTCPDPGNPATTRQRPGNPAVPGSTRQYPAIPGNPATRQPESPDQL